MFTDQLRVFAVLSLKGAPKVRRVESAVILPAPFLRHVSINSHNPVRHKTARLVNMTGAHHLTTSFILLIIKLKKTHTH